MFVGFLAGIRWLGAQDQGTGMEEVQRGTIVAQAKLAAERKRAASRSKLPSNSRRRDTFVGVDLVEFRGVDYCPYSF